jgi:pyruvate dehydrogenase E2 component (dihydrolipoamide acetyltransferase)
MARPIVVPNLGMFTAEATLSAWLRPAGTRVEAGEPVAEVTSEKATQEVVAPENGIVYHHATVGATLPTQGLLGYILAVGEVPPAQPLESTTAAPEATAGSAPAPARAAAPTTGEVRATPIARRLAQEHQIDLTQVTGSGPGGRIVEADVLAAVARRSETPPPAASGVAAGRQVRETVPITRMRQTIGERLRASLSTAAPVTLTREVDAEVLVATRGQLNERLGRSVPYDALFAKLLATALRARPDLNAAIDQDRVLVFDEIHVGFAVSVEAGLLVPVLRDADRRSLADLAAEVRELSERARTNQLRPTDVSGGTVTITNLGNYGVDGFSPIINPPQSAILGIGRILARPVVRDGALAVGQTVVLSLTFDHRVVDGVPAAQLLDDIARLMQDEGYLLGLAG